jgi:transcriptional antiterminator RfaH
MKQSQWHIAHTRPQRERKVTDLFARKGLIAYCPLNRIEVKHGPKKKLESHPLFPSFVFVNVEEQQKPAILRINGVINFVYWLYNAAIIRHEEIIAIRIFLADYPQVILEKTAVNIHQPVQFINDSRVARKGNVMEITHPGSKLILPSLGYILMSDTASVDRESFIHQDVPRLKA